MSTISNTPSSTQQQQIVTSIYIPRVRRAHTEESIRMDFSRVATVDRVDFVDIADPMLTRTFVSAFVHISKWVEVPPWADWCSINGPRAAEADDIRKRIASEDGQKVKFYPRYGDASEYWILYLAKNPVKPTTKNLHQLASDNERLGQIVAELEEKMIHMESIVSRLSAAHITETPPPSPHAAAETDSNDNSSHLGLW